MCSFVDELPKRVSGWGADPEVLDVVASLLEEETIVARRADLARTFGPSTPTGRNEPYVRLAIPKQFHFISARFSKF